MINKQSFKIKYNLIVLIYFLIQHQMAQLEKYHPQIQ